MLHIHVIFFAPKSHLGDTEGILCKVSPCLAQTGHALLDTLNFG